MNPSSPIFLSDLYCSPCQVRRLKAKLYTCHRCSETHAQCPPSAQATSAPAVTPLGPAPHPQLLPRMPRNTGPAPTHPRVPPITLSCKHGNWLELVFKNKEQKLTKKPKTEFQFCQTKRCRSQSEANALGAPICALRDGSDGTLCYAHFTTILGKRRKTG